MTYETEAVVPAKIGEPSFRTTYFDMVANDQGLTLNLDLVEIKIDKARLHMIANQHRCPVLQSAN